MRGRTGNGWAGQRLRLYRLLKSEICIVPNHERHEEMRDWRRRGKSPRN